MSNKEKPFKSIKHLDSLLRKLENTDKMSVNKIMLMVGYPHRLTKERLDFLGIPYKKVDAVTPQVLQLYKEGHTIPEILQVVKVSRQRVHQILVKNLGSDFENYVEQKKEDAYIKAADKLNKIGLDELVYMIAIKNKSETAKYLNVSFAHLNRWLDSVEGELVGRDGLTVKELRYQHNVMKKYPLLFDGVSLKTLSKKELARKSGASYTTICRIIKRFNL